MSPGSLPTCCRWRDGPGNCRKPPKPVPGGSPHRERSSTTRHHSAYNSKIQATLALGVLDKATMNRTDDEGKTQIQRNPLAVGSTTPLPGHFGPRNVPTMFKESINDLN